MSICWVGQDSESRLSTTLSLGSSGSFAKLRLAYIAQGQHALIVRYTPFSSASSDAPVWPPRTQEEERTFHSDKMRKPEPSAIPTLDPLCFITFVCRIIKLLFNVVHQVVLGLRSPIFLLWIILLKSVVILLWLKPELQHLGSHRRVFLFLLEKAETIIIIFFQNRGYICGLTHFLQGEWSWYPSSPGYKRQNKRENNMENKRERNVENKRKG